MLRGNFSDNLPGDFYLSEATNRMLKKAHLLCCPHFSSLRRTSMYVSFLKISGASQLDLFEHPVKGGFPQTTKMVLSINWVVKSKRLAPIRKFNFPNGD